MARKVESGPYPDLAQEARTLYQNQKTTDKPLIYYRRVVEGSLDQIHKQQSVINRLAKKALFKVSLGHLGNADHNPEQDLEAARVQIRDKWKVPSEQNHQKAKAFVDANLPELIEQARYEYNSKQNQQ